MSKEDFFKLSLPGNKEIPSIADCLKLCRNEIYGRHIVTTQDLKCGEIIAIEKPFYKSLDKRSSPRRCANCLKSIINPIACFSCKSVLFCSEDCRKSAWTEFHGFECHYIDEMTEDDGFLMMVERSLFKALSISGNLENLQKLVEKNEESAVFVSSGNLILACFSLEESEPTEGEIDFAERFVDNHEHVKQLHKTDDQRNFLIGFILNIIGVLNRNSFTLHWSSPESNQEETGCGIFPFSSLINHSCSANVSRVCYEGNLVLVTKQPIAANQQIFICYQNVFHQKPRDERQQSLLKQFNFVCSCVACENNFPLTDDLKTFDENFIDTSDNIDSHASAIQAFQSNCEYIERHFEQFPSLEICRLMQSNSKILKKIASDVF